MGRRAAVIYCAVALLVFGVLSYTAASRKSATYDEPLHVAQAAAVVRGRDFTVEPDHPPLWLYWAAVGLAVGDDPLPHLDLSASTYRAIRENVQEGWTWSVDTLYHTRGNDGVRAVARARSAMVFLAVALGAAVAALAYRAGGPVAACVAVTAFALDPNFLAHGSLAKNDVALTLGTTGLALALCAAWRRLTPWTIAAVGLTCAAAVTTKLTGLLVAPVVVSVLTIRACCGGPWVAAGRVRSTLGARLVVAAGACLACAAITYVGIWAAYGFRFAPTPDPTAHFDVAAVVSRAARAQAVYDAMSHGRSRFDVDAAVADWNPGWVMTAAIDAIDRHWLPESYAHGILFAYSSRFRVAYLCGETYIGSKWYYFPVAVAVKTPVATLAAIAASAVILLRRRIHAGRAMSGPAVVVLVSAGVFSAMALTADLNIGIRHVLPLYPFLFVAVGAAAARMYAVRPRPSRVVLVVLGTALAAESLAVFPDYLPFFNVAAGGTRGGVHWLGDSNLDWGQDLPLLAEWQRAHPDRELHLAYFGQADPACYGIRYRNAPAGYMYGAEPPATELPTSGVLAVSASVLQGINSTDLRGPYVAFRDRPPTQVLGGSIYLFDLDQR